ncbi:hypothetical protein DKT77_17280 [Meridianimarinicoccus roseus]|uniref:VPLPA-CTERM sorting domain-containing protein n=1 Tax=Meridianimarinicoccus roseus TaxID=2072018 RepID=A0A2V2LDE3_9RHOB|nr:VPLPA-CTERM sorting domain-containing protein [Meridianimarinicoccus roseus]PWR01316.1 hypothetical protein DKT77_17280 [Meridianimarinicoccus roseus]
MTGLGSPAFEHVHVGRQFTISFDSEISRLLIYAENGGTALLTGIDLGFAPCDFGGATAASGATGFTVNTSHTASYFLYEFATPTTSVVNVFSGGTSDGFDMAFFAQAAPGAQVPLPAGLPLVLAGLGALVMLRRRI